MPLITAVRQRGSKSKVFVDGEFFAEVDGEAAALRGVREGVELSREELVEACREGERALAVSRALNLLGYRARSAKEVRERLLRHGHSGSVADEVVGRLRELGYLDDEEFARTMAREKARKYGPRRVSAELIKGGVDRDVVGGVVEEEFAGRSELEDARLAAARRYNAVAGSVDEAGAEAQARRVYGFLARRGYSVEVCAEVAREYREPRSPETGE